MFIKITLQKNSLKPQINEQNSTKTTYFRINLSKYLVFLVSNIFFSETILKLIMDRQGFLETL